MLKRSDVEQYMGFMGFRITDLVQKDKSIKYKDVIPYFYPAEKELINNIKIENGIKNTQLIIIITA